MISLALMMTDMLRYAATSGSSVAAYGIPCRVDMGNVGLTGTKQRKLYLCSNVRFQYEPREWACY